MHVIAYITYITYTRVTLVLRITYTEQVPLLIIGLGLYTIPKKTN